MIRPKFKVGDRVRCIKREGRQIGEEDCGYGWQLNKEFKIVKISNLDGSESTKGIKESIYWDNDGGVFEGVLELVEKIIKQYVRLAL